MIISQELFATTLGADGQARRTILYEGSTEFTLHRLAVRFGLPALPEWAAWFHEELKGRGLIEELVGLNCLPVAAKGTKLRLLRLLSTGLKRRLIQVPGAVEHEFESDPQQSGGREGPIPGGPATVRG